MFLTEYQKQEAKRIAQRAKNKTNYISNKIIYKEEVDQRLSKEFSRMLNDEIIKMGYDPELKKREWDKEIEEGFEKSIYKNI